MFPNNDEFSEVNQILVEVISGSEINDIPGVIAVMRRIDEVLSNEDGLKWFNFLYLRVTESVSASPPPLGWENPQFLQRLAVVFATLYLDAVVKWQHNRDNVARAWSPLFEARANQNIMRVQFAIAGMNAHINHDLCIALVQTAEEHNIVPRRNSPEHRDFERVNDILEVVAEQVKETLATGIAGEIDQDLGRLDDTIAFWSVRRARETAWINAEILWELRTFPLLHDAFLVNIDRLVGLTNRGFLIPMLATPVI